MESECCPVYHNGVIMSCKLERIMFRTLENLCFELILSGNIQNERL